VYLINLFHARREPVTQIHPVLLAELRSFLRFFNNTFSTQLITQFSENNFRVNYRKLRKPIIVTASREVLHLSELFGPTLTL